jgi:hypothetical protein
MKNRWTLLASVGLIVGSAAIGSAQADNDKPSATLFTPRDRGDHFVCAAVNVGDKTLRSITFRILGSDGALLTPAAGSADTNPTSSLSVSPGAAAEIDINLAPPDDGYCEVACLGQATVTMSASVSSPLLPARSPAQTPLSRSS